MKKILLFLCLLSSATLLLAQDAGLGKKVNLTYKEVRLGRALKGISKDYKVNFSYSKDFIPLNKKVTVEVQNEPLSVALDELFAPTKIIYAPIGDQIVLKVNARKRIIQRDDSGLTGSLDSRPVPNQPKPTYTSIPAPPVRRTEPIRHTPLLRTPSLEPVDWPEDFPRPDEEIFLVEPYEYETNNPYTRLAQLSFMPEIGTNLGRSEEIINNVSVNVLWGRNGGVNGVEIGGLVNSIEGDVHGLQIAGLANLVKGDLNGSALTKKQRARAGVQIAGITNVAASVKGCQITACFNRAYDGGVKGFQMAGLGNGVNGNVEGWQFAGLYNYNQGDAGFQIAGLFNRAKDVSKGQASAFINIAREVGGFQIGLINFADTVVGVPIGLLNFVRHGYNMLEVSKSESFKAALAVRFGAQRFYNILEVSVPNEGKIKRLFSTEPDWALGYGIGTSVGKKRWSWQLEAITHQVNEGQRWLKDINMLTQLRLTINLKTWEHLSFFAGPTINIFITGKYNPDTQEFDSQLLRESTFVDETFGDEVNPKRVQGWIGYKAGLRF